MFFVVRSNDSLNFPLGLIKYIVIVKRLQSLMHNFVRRERRELSGSREQRYLKAINFIDIHTNMHGRFMHASCTERHADISKQAIGQALSLQSVTCRHMQHNE